MMKSRRIRWAVTCSAHGELRNEYDILVGNHEGKRPLGKPECRWEGNIAVDLG
jgi:hypothetical protein